MKNKNKSARLLLFEIDDGLKKFSDIDNIGSYFFNILQQAEVVNRLRLLLALQNPPQLHRVVQVFFVQILRIRVVPLVPVQELQYPLISRSRNLVLFLGLQL